MVIVYTGNGKGFVGIMGDRLPFSSHKKAANTNLILTGRNAPKRLIEMADIATEMREIKYRFTLAKQGIEY